MKMIDKKYKTIKEVSDLLNINQHVIRYWDSKFEGLSIRFSKKKQRYFNNEHIKKIQDLKNTLYQNGKHNYSLDLASKILDKNKNFSQNVSKINLSKVSKFDVIKLKKIRDNLNKILLN